MAIKVQYQDNSFGDVPDDALDDLIAAGSIIAFRRRDGWVEIGQDPLRGQGGSAGYEGAERRGIKEQRNCLICPDFVDSMCRSSVCPYRTSLQGKSPK